MKAIIGTAGHIDHGKSALIRALTGIETDRLPEERDRGISIELGFAYLELADGERAGIVDVPGHERFIRQMLAGAHGFDLVLLVVAADDGVMPQTEEHFEICHLLGVRKAIFVVTKCDLATAARVEEVRGEIEILAAGTEFEAAPAMAVSANTGEGIEALRDRILESLEGLERTGDRGAFRMSVDRAFVLKGHGVVVTGTAAAGSVAPGESIEIAPHGRAARVRDVQVHGRAVERAWVGQRVALNLVGVDLGEVARGDTVVAPELGAPTDRFDATIEVRPSARRAVKSHERVRVYVGTAEAAGRVIWLDGIESIEPRSSGYAQIALREPTVAFAGDRFVIRDETAERTLGGGRVLLARARRHRASEGAVGPRLEKLGSADPTTRLAAFVDLAASLGVTPAELALGVGGDETAALAAASACAEIVLLPDAEAPVLIVSRSRLEAYLDELVALTRAFHDAKPSAGGIELERLRRNAHHDVDARLFRTLVDGLAADGRVVRRGGQVALPQHEVSMSDADEELAARLLAAIRENPTMPPALAELERRFSMSAKHAAEVVGVLGERGEVVKVSTDLVFAREVVDDIEAQLRSYLEREKQITAAGFRDLISASRKYSIPLLDHFDRSGVTVRSGDFRRLRTAD